MNGLNDGPVLLCWFQAEGEDNLKKMQLMELAILNGTYRDANVKTRKHDIIANVEEGWWVTGWVLVQESTVYTNNASVSFVK